MLHAAPSDEELLREALDLAPGASVTRISREPLGDGSVVGFDVVEGAASVTYFLDTSGRTVPRETGLLVGEPDAPEMRVWLHPADPHLPALAPVAFAHAAESMLARLGLTAAGAPETVVYRAGRRAVFRVPTDDGLVWVKVVPPARIGRIVRAHAAFDRAGVPVPTVRGWSDEGMVVLDSAAGTPATQATWTAAALVDQVDRLRGAIARIPLKGRARTDLRRRAAWYADRFEHEAPGYARRVRELRRRIETGWRDGRERSVHGDLHFGQLFLGDSGELSAVIDVDTAGTGAASDDTAAFVSHALSSALLTPVPHDERVWLLAGEAFARWDADADAGDGLRGRTVSHLLGHALGAVQRGDEARTGALLDAADAVLEGRVTRPRA